MNKVILTILIVLQIAIKINAQESQLLWWQQSIVYQIYPRSFQDSDGDGIGDLNGIISRLDYFVDIGVDAIWISPIYKSPMKDFGYDISDFRDIEPAFGTLDDFKNMSSEFKKRGIKLIMDFVPNHSSDQHEWFQKSVQRIDPYTDYYTWKNASGFDAEGNPIPPNNWISNFGGSAWEWRDERQQFYLHQFVVEQPDLNYENPQVQSEMLDTVKYWLDLGVDGVRVDAVSTLFEDQQFLDEPEDPNRPIEAQEDEYRYWLHIYTNNQPQTLVFLEDMRKLIDIYSISDGIDRVMMTEAYLSDNETMEYYGTEQNPIAHFPFNFHLIQVNPQLEAQEILNLINVWYDLMPSFGWANFVLGNHDRARVPERWTLEGIDGANMINLLLKGTAVTYYGEEIGMENKFLTWEETVDPAACNTDPERYQNFTRDPVRTPMQWNGDVSAGFSSNSSTWLPVHENYVTVNVEVQNEAEESHLKVYKELVGLRKTNVWRYGEYDSKALNNNQVLAFTRITQPEVDPMGLLVLVNLADVEVLVDTSTAFPLVPSVGTVKVRSVGFLDDSVTIGSDINTGAIPLGPRNSIVISFEHS